MTNNKDEFNILLNSEHNILFMSATPRIYELENEIEADTESEIEIDTDYIFGEIIYKMSFNEAIENKYITDYQIWLPSISEDNTELNNELSIYEIDNTIKAKITFLFSCILNNGSRKCIIYCKNINEISNMIEAINKLNEFYCIDIDIQQITSGTLAKNRTIILNNFATNTNIQLLFSVRILDECIDIPSCDSIYITYPTKNKIRTIQRLSRCIRIDLNNKFKIGNIFIWCDAYDKILDTLSGIKEYDTNFNTKIKINETNYYNKSTDEKIKLDIKLIENYVLGIKEFKQLVGMKN
jgi:superfamily II DNA or RNA helicase